MSPVFSYVPSYIMLLVGAISIIAGILNATSHGQKERTLNGLNENVKI